VLICIRLKKAAGNPASLTQAAIINNLDAAEKHRLERIRNIGIAVSTETLKMAAST
jgi:elongation factor G